MTPWHYFPAFQISNESSHTLFILRAAYHRQEGALLHCDAQALKILSRKGANRLKLKGSDIAGILQQLHSPCNQQVAAEAANVLLNACYEKTNVRLVIENGGLASVVRLLKDRSAEVQANVAGTLQSISFQVSHWPMSQKAWHQGQPTPAGPSHHARIYKQPSSSHLMFSAMPPGSGEPFLLDIVM